MTNEIFGVDIAQIVNDTFRGNLLRLTLTKIVQGDPDDYGVPTTTTTDYAGEGVRSNWSTAIAIERGYSVSTVKILVMQNGTTPEPSTDDQITIMGATYRVFDIAKDPVDATWNMAAVKV